jgi:hypothetical protein
MGNVGRRKMEFVVDDSSSDYGRRFPFTLVINMIHHYTLASLFFISKVFCPYTFYGPKNGKIGQSPFPFDTNFKKL